MMFNVGRSEYSSTLDKRSIPPRFNVVRLFMIPFLSTFRSYLVGYFFSLKNAQKFYQSLKKETQELNEEIEELNSSRGKGDTKDGVFGIGCHVECV